MSIVASRISVLPDLACVLTLRAPDLGAEVRSAMEPAGFDKLPWWFNADNGIHSTVLLRIHVTELMGNCELSLQMWADPAMGDVTTVWEAGAPIKLGHSIWTLDTKELFANGPAAGAKHIGISHDLYGYEAAVAFSAEIVKAIPPG